MLEKEFRLGDLFDIKPTKSYKMNNDELFECSGKTPVVSNSSVNNGITGFSPLEPTEKKPIITFSDTTKGAETIFYQPVPFIGYSHVQGLYPKTDDVWSEKACLYLVSVFRKASGVGYDYATKFQRTQVADFKIKLPVKEGAENEIDFEYMEERIKELEEERIKELEEERIKELEAYLLASGLNDYTLTEEDISTLSLSGPGGHKESDSQDASGIRFKEFRLGDLFEVYSPQKRFDANKIKFGGDYPYVCRSALNNGIKGYITEDVKFLSPARTLSFGQDTATVFYQEHPYFTGDKIKVFKLKGRELNRRISLFFISAIKKAFILFGWGQDSYDEALLKGMKIKLPVKEGAENEIDYEYMENYIRALEKITIAEVVKYKDDTLNAAQKTVAELV